MSTAETATGSLRPYVPRLLSHWRATHGDPRHMQVEGSLAFVDISGFTRLTERLARRGKVGAEEMSDLLNATFTALLEDARAQEADLLKWGGDAVLLLFRGADHAGRACRAVVDMRATLRTVGNLATSGGAVTLRMSVGVHSGRFDLYLVGDQGHHRELFVVGPEASTTAALESLAAAGQVLVSDVSASLLPAGTHRPGPAATGRLLRARPPELHRPVPLPGHPATGDLLLGRFLPTPIREHLLADVGDPEHRTVAVAFVKLSGTDALTERRGVRAVADALDECVRVVQAATAEHGVTFFETDIDRDGAKIMLVSGAPRSAGHDEERMLRTVRSVMDRAGVLPLRIGVNRGNVFAGDFGPAFRRTYSIKGDAVNLAARVMGRAADGEVLATAATLERSDTLFRSTPLEPFLVKGKTHPVHAARLGEMVGRRTAPVAASSFVGRAEELSTLQDALTAARRGQGRQVDLVGEPGIGKSRLARELVSGSPDVLVLRSVCEEYESSTAYFPFRSLLRGAIGLPPDADRHEVAQRLQETVASLAPDLEPWLPLLGIPLDLDLEPTQQTSELDEQFRKTRLEEAVDDLLARLLTAPTVLLLEDAHHVDDASADLVARLARQMAERPWLLLVTRRDVGSGYEPDTGAPVTRVRPAPLAADDALRMVRVATADTPMTNDALAALLARSGGNPLFLEELLRAAAQSGSVSELPESVDDLVTSQVDRLDPLDRTVLRYAAVLGVVVDLPVLRELLSQHYDEVDLGQRLPALHDFLERDGRERLRFRQALIRDVAYEGLPFRRRQVLHEQVGRTIERSADDPDAISEVLSLHFFHARRYGSAWAYSRTAGMRAKAKYAHGEAVDFFQRAVESARRAGDVPPRDLGEVLEALGDASELSGRPAAAVEAFRQARRQPGADPVTEAELLFKEARVHQRRGKVTQSLRILTRAMHSLEGVDSPGARSTRSRLATRYSFGRLMQGRHAEALRWGAVAAREAEDSGDKAALAHAYNGLHSVHVNAGSRSEVPYGRLALLAYEELADLAGQGHSANNLGVEALAEGRWTEAQGLFERASGTFARLGDEANQANAVYNQADVLVRQGHLEGADGLLRDVLRIARAVEDEELVALALRERGRVSAGTGSYAEALQQLADARTRFTALGSTRDLLGVGVAEAECLLLAGRDDDALVVLDGLLEAVDPAHPDDLDPAVHRVRGFVLLCAGRREEAAAAFRAVVETAAGTDARHELGFALLGLALLAEDPAVREARKRESAAVLDPLGVVVTPTWPARR